MKPHLALALCLLLAPAIPARMPAQDATELPPGPAQRAWADLGPGQAPAPDDATALPWPAWRDEGAWTAAAPWERWGALLDAPHGDRVRAGLAGAALAQGRFDDAWGHFAAVADPALRARLFPHFLPGSPAEHPALPGARPAPLAAGAVLAPALPPPADGDSRGGGRAREMRSAPFTVASAGTLERAGEARADVRVLFEPGSGVQVDLRHLEGAPLSLTVRIPVPADVALEAVYLDWDRLEEASTEVSVQLSAERPEVSLWAAFLPHRSGFSQEPLARLPAGFAAGGIRVRAQADPRCERFAAVLAELLELPLVAGSAPAPVLHPLELCTGEPGELRALVSAAERFLLAAAARDAGEKAATSEHPR